MAKYRVREPIERFNDGVLVDDNGCWLWQKAILVNGYGYFRIAGINELAHRFSYKVFKDAPQGTIDHLCRVRHCVNPDHLEDVSPRTNILRGIGIAAQNFKKKYCIKGHPLSGTNLYRRKDRDTRECKTCRREATIKFSERKLA